MQADFSVELGGDAPALEIPWRSADPQVAYYDLKTHPHLIQQIPEAVAYPELASFLLRMNAAGFPMATAKCDVWSSNEVAPEEEIFGDRKFVSYVDLVFVDEADQCSFQKHEDFSKELCRLLSLAPEIAAKVELVIRHCYYHHEKAVPQEKMALSRDPTEAQDKQPQWENDYREENLQKKAALQRDSAETQVKRLPLENNCLEENPQEKAALPRDLAATQVKRLPLENDCLEENPQKKAALPRDSAEAQDKQLELENDCVGKDSPIAEAPTTFCSGENSPAVGDPTLLCTGFCITAYVTGFGDADHEPVRLWTISLNLLQHAIVQICRRSGAAS